MPDDVIKQTKDYYFYFASMHDIKSINTLQIVAYILFLLDPETGLQALRTLIFLLLVL